MTALLREISWHGSLDFQVRLEGFIAAEVEKARRTAPNSGYDCARLVDVAAVPTVWQRHDSCAYIGLQLSHLQLQEAPRNAVQCEHLTALWGLWLARHSSTGCAGLKLLLVHV